VDLVRWLVFAYPNESRRACQEIVQRVTSNPMRALLLSIVD